MPEFELEPLLSALEGDAPCGADLEYDAAFLALQEAAAGKPERQYGDKVYAAEPADWPTAFDKALALARRTRDLRVATWLARSAAHVQGLAGAVRGLQLVHGLIERHWDHVHPQLDAGEGNDPTMRLNALAQLVHPGAGLADLRIAALTDQRGSPTVRDIELGIGRGEPLAGEMVPSEEGLTQAIAAAFESNPGLREAMAAGHAAVQGIDAALAARLGGAAGPEFAPLKKLLAAVAEAARRAAGEAPPADAAPAAPRQGSSAAGTIASREDAVQALQRVCDWLERNEPSNPAPLLIRRAQRLMSKNFLEIMRDLVPEGVDHIEKLAGIGNE